MKLKKLNEKQIALTNEMMLNLIGGRLVDGIELGTTQFSYTNCPNGASDFGSASTDRVTNTWAEDAINRNGYWSPGGSYTCADPRI